MGLRNKDKVDVYEHLLHAISENAKEAQQDLGTATMHLLETGSIYDAAEYISAAMSRLSDIKRCADVKDSDLLKKYCDTDRGHTNR